MKKQKIVIAVLVILLLCCVAIAAMLYFAAPAFISSVLTLPGVTADWHLAFDLLQSTDKKAHGVGVAALAVSFGLPVLIFGGMAIATFMPKRRALHGSARWANALELRKAGLLQADKPDDKYPSVVVGKYGKDFLFFRGQQFMFLAAPTRSGKGVGIVIPNLLHYRDSVVCLDIKGENFEMTAGFRAQCGQEVHRFAPDDENFQTACWNPLGYVREDHNYRTSDLMGITNILYPPSDDVWGATAESLFLGLSLYCMDTDKEKPSFNVSHIKRLAVMLDFLKDEDTFMKYVDARKGFEPLSEDCIFHLRKFAQTSDKMRVSILISFDSPLAIFSDPITGRATDKNTFDLREVRRKRMSIYLVIKPSSIDRFGKFLNLFFTQLIQLNIQVLPQDDPTLKVQCLLMLDEFPAMGRVAIIEKASAYMAGYNMRLLLIFQSKSQVEDKKLYDKTGAQTMLTNMALQICYAPRDEQDAKDYSEMIGYNTEKGLSQSRQVGGLLGGKSGGSDSVSDQRRAVLLPQEVKEIGMDKEIISLENVKPALVNKIFWYKEPVFTAREGLPLPPVPSQAPLSNTIEPIPQSPASPFKAALQLQTMPAGASFEVGFSPQRNALEVVMAGIKSAKSQILVASYSFTSQPIAHALAEAKAQGIDVRVVVDHEQNNAEQGGYNAMDFLVKEKIPVVRNSNYAAMHHKFMVIDGLHVQLGSFNYTKSANERNAETAILIHNAGALATVYKTEWTRLATEPKVSPGTVAMVDKGLSIIQNLMKMKG